MALPEHLAKNPVGKARVSDEVLAEHQRARTIKAASTVFAEIGYRTTTVDDIVSAAKIGVGNFYKLFRGKEGCFLAALDEALALLKTELETAVKAESDWHQEVQTGLEAGLAFMASHPHRARLLLIESEAAGSEARRQRWEALAALERGLARGRSLSQRKRKLPKKLEQALAGGLLWYLTLNAAEIADDGIDDHLQAAMEILIVPYLGHSTSAKAGA